MKINSITLENFRNLKQGSMLPCENVNILYGDNAQGKTNIIEAIWLLTGERSFRFGRDSEMITIGLDTTQKRSFINCKAYTGEREEEIIYNLSPKKQILLNGIALPSQNALIGVLNCVVFSPVHLSLIKDGPANRRDFVDSAISQLKPQFAKVLSDYARVLTQRSSLLRDIPHNPYLIETLDVWDSHLLRLGKIIIETRLTYINRLGELAREYHSGISGGEEELVVKYSSPFKTSELEQGILEARREDIRTGSSTVGPHRDDVEIMINGISARSYASQGQQRSGVLALKLAECEMISQTTSQQPVVLLDDVMSELDGHRRRFLLEGMGERQIFITGCDKSILAEGARYRSFYIEKGSISSGEDCCGIFAKGE